MSNINYTGPDLQYQPYAGDNQAVSPSFTSANSGPQYASLPTLESLLSTLNSVSSDLLVQLEDQLKQLSVDISGDSNAIAANLKTYPPSLGTVSSFVTYNYYKYLETLNTASATYLRNAYEQGARDIDGNNSIDLLPIVQAIHTEAGLISDFVTNNITTLSDSSEQRSVEGFQDWCTAAISQLQNVRLLFTSTSQNYQLSDAETRLLSTQDATNTQALFKVNLNQLNVKIAQDLQTLNTNFAQFASTFYTDFFGPALNFRQNVTSQILPVYPGKLGAEISFASNIANDHMNTILTDQLNRLYTFNTLVFATLQDIENRDAYRYFIQQLANIGASYTSSITNQTDHSTAVDFFTTIASNAGLASYEASHQDLDNRNDPASHTQYVLNTGDTMTGNLNITTDVRVDGIVPSTHIHNGADGSHMMSTLYYNPGTAATPNYSGVYDATNQRWSFYADEHGQPVVYGSWATYSSIKYKKNIEPMAMVSAKINQLNPIRYHYHQDKDYHRKRSGLLVEEVKEIFPEIVISDNIVYEELIPILIKAIQELSIQVKELQNGK